MNSIDPNLQLAKIIIKNFKTYKNDMVFDLSRDTQKTITTIQNEIDHGKTTFLDSIYWCLYGEISSNDKDILSHDIIDNLQTGDFAETAVEIHIFEQDEFRYKIHRIIEYIKNPESNKITQNDPTGGRVPKTISLYEKIRFGYVDSDDDWKITRDPERAKIAIEHILPKTAMGGFLRKYFRIDKTK